MSSNFISKLCRFYASKFAYKIFKLIDIENRTSIDCIFYGIKEKFKNVSKPDLLKITKSWTTEIILLEKKPTNSIIRDKLLSKSDLNPIKTENRKEL